MSINWKEILLNFFFWLASAWLITSSFSIQTQEIELINNQETVRTIRNESLIIGILVCIAISFFMFYLNLGNIRKLQFSRSRLRVSMISLLLLLGTLGLAAAINRVTIYSTPIPIPYSLSMGIVAFYFTISTAYGLGKAWHAVEKRQQQLLIGKKQAELNLLRNQLQPHFLFNALNNLLSMVDQKQSPQLAQAFERLSQLLRYVIDESHSSQVRIAQEIEFIRNYVGLQLLRFEADEIALNFMVTGTYEDQLLEPGIFIPFVENAFKYGSEPEHRASIDLEFDISQENEIYFSIRNTIFKVPHQAESSGTGIKSAMARLELIYPKKHELIISKDGSFLVSLKINTT